MLYIYNGTSVGKQLPLGDLAFTGALAPTRLYVAKDA